MNDLNLGDSTVFDDPATQLYPMWIPPNSVFTMYSADPSHCVLLRVYMQTTNPVTVLMQESHNLDHLKITNNTYPTVNSPRGTHLLHPQERRFYITLCGGFNGATSYVLRVEERVQVSVSMELSFSEFFAESVPQQATIEQTVELYERTTGLEALVNNMALLLSIPQSTIKVACVHAAGQPCVPLELMLAGARKRALRSSEGGARYFRRAVSDPTVLELNISAPNPVNATGNSTAYAENLAFLQGVTSLLANMSNNASLQLGLVSAINSSIATSNRSIALGGVTALVAANGIGYKSLIGSNTQVNNNTQGGYTIVQAPLVGATTPAPTQVTTTILPTPGGDAASSAGIQQNAIVAAAVVVAVLVVVALGAVKYKKSRKSRKAKLKVRQRTEPKPRTKLVPLHEASEPSRVGVTREDGEERENGRSSRASEHHERRFPQSVTSVDALPIGVPVPVGLPALRPQATPEYPTSLSPSSTVGAANLGEVAPKAKVEPFDPFRTSLDNAY